MSRNRSINAVPRNIFLMHNEKKNTKTRYSRAKAERDSEQKSHRHHCGWIYFSSGGDMECVWAWAWAWETSSVNVVNSFGDFYQQLYFFFIIQFSSTHSIFYFCSNGVWYLCMCVCRCVCVVYLYIMVFLTTFFPFFIFLSFSLGPLPIMFCYCYCFCRYCFIVACVFVFYINE